MADLVNFIVAREHHGDRITDDGMAVHHFHEGETRKADPAVVAHLVRAGVLVDPDAPAAKADEPLENKSEGDSPSNKGGGDSKGK